MVFASDATLAQNTLLSGVPLPVPVGFNRSRTVLSPEPFQAVWLSHVSVLSALWNVERPGLGATWPGSPHASMPWGSAQGLCLSYRSTTAVSFLVRAEWSMEKEGEKSFVGDLGFYSTA